jgi:hypothetical protein
MYVTKRAVAVNFVENDSVYIHGKKLMVTGKEGNRIIRAFNNVRFYKTDMSGKCDSIHSSSKTALTKMIGNPILWNAENQITGDIMHLIGNNNTQKLDSLKVLENTFIVSRDTLGTGYNQVKGQNLYGKFEEGKLHDVDIVKNAEVIYYMRNEAQELIGINKNKSSKINLILEKNEIETKDFTNSFGDVFTVILDKNTKTFEISSDSLNTVLFVSRDQNNKVRSVFDSNNVNQNWFLQTNPDLSNFLNNWLAMNY